MVVMFVTFRPARSNVFSAQPSEGEITHQTVRGVLMAYNRVRTNSRIVRVPVYYCPICVLRRVHGELTFRRPWDRVVEMDLDHPRPLDRLFALAIQQRRIRLGPTLPPRNLLGILPPQIHVRPRICDYCWKEVPLHDKHRSLVASR